MLGRLLIMNSDDGKDNHGSISTVSRSTSWIEDPHSTTSANRLGLGRAPARRGRLRTSLIILIPILLALPAAAQDIESTSNPQQILARLGDPDLPVSPPQRRRIVRLARDARWAAPVELDREFRVRAPAGTRSLIFSIGTKAGVDRQVKVRFQVARVQGSRRDILFDEWRPGGEEKWNDRRISLPEHEGELDLAFRILGSTSPVEEEEERAPGGDSIRGWWGSILFAGKEPSKPLTFAKDRQRPNVLLVSLDTLGAEYLGAFDPAHPISPRIDAFLNRGFSFRQALAPYPSTLPSHSSLFTGLRPIHHGRYKGTQKSLLSQVQRMADAGYFTAAFTENVYISSHHGFAAGFDWYDDGDANKAEAVWGNARETFGNAAQWLMTRGNDYRFFLFVHTYEVHSPYVIKDRVSRRTRQTLNPDDPRQLDPQVLAEWIIKHNYGEKIRGRRDIELLASLHRAEIASLDVLFGKFIKRLSRLGLARDTLVVVTSDHGDLFGEDGRLGHGVSLHNKVLHVPLAFRWPGVVVRGGTSQKVELVDVMPTLLEMVGEDVPSALDGRSLKPLLLGTGPIPERPAFSELIYDPGACPKKRRGCRVDRFSVQTERFKFVTSQVPEYEHLYDLKADPAEKVDVSADHPAEVRRHRAYLEDYLSEQEAPEATEQKAIEQGVEIDPETQRLLKELGYIE